MKKVTVGICIITTLLLAQGLTGGGAWGAAGGLPGTGDREFNPASDSEGNHCFAPGGDGNDILGVSEQIVGPRGCSVVNTGEFYIPAIFWFTNFSFAVVPADFTAAADTPMDDFLAKVRQIRFVVDPGSERERTFRYLAHDIVRLDTFDELLPWFDSFPVAHFLAKLPPLPPGNHSVQTFMTMSALHCDGFGTVMRQNCFPQGESVYSTIHFEVVRGASQSA